MPHYPLFQQWRQVNCLSPRQQTFKTSAIEFLGGNLLVRWVVWAAAWFRISCSQLRRSVDRSIGGACLLAWLHDWQVRTCNVTGSLYWKAKLRPLCCSFSCVHGTSYICIHVYRVYIYIYIYWYVVPSTMTRMLESASVGFQCFLCGLLALNLLERTTHKLEEFTDNVFQGLVKA